MTAVRQRTDADCGVTSLAIVLVDLAMREVDPKMRGLQALYNRELVAAGQRIKPVTFRPKRRFDLDRDEGILRLHWNDRKRRKASPYGHYVAVLQGSIHCPNAHVVLPWRDYVVKFDARPVTLLRLAR